MKRFGGVLIAAAMLAPAMASAQTRPSGGSDINSAEVYLDKARQSRNDKDRKDATERALASAQKAIAAKPDNPRAYLLAGQAHTLLGNILAADSMYDQAERLWPEYAATTERDRMQLWIRSYNAGIVAMNANNNAEAIAAFELADAIHAKRPTARLNLAKLYAQTNQLEKAADMYRKSLEILRGSQQGLKPEEIQQWKTFEEAATFNLAQLLASTGKNEEAITEFKEFLTRNPTHTQAKVNLAVVYSRLNRTADAAKLYEELLSQDLTDVEFFNVGVGLYRSTQPVLAGEAFRKAIAKNPYMREAQYNLAQVLYAAANKLQEEKGTAKGEAVKAIDAKLLPIYTQMLDVTEKLRAIDPSSRNVLALRAQALRAMADLTTDAKASTDFRTKTLEVLKLHEALKFDVEAVALTPGAGDVMELNGTIVNLNGKAGESVKLRVHFIGKSGQTIGSQDVTVSLPAVQGGAPFKATITTKEEVAGWKYEVLP